MYGHDGYGLLVTGVGRVQVEKTLGAFFKQFSNERQLFLVNIGVAGGDVEHTKIGEMYVINKIVEATTGKTYLPDILFRHSLRETSLLTVSEPITKPTSVQLPLVDMEAAGIWQVASRFLPPHRIIFIKIVSDYCDGNLLSAGEIESLIQENMPEILTLLRTCQEESFYGREILTSKDHDLLTECQRVLRLTTTQYFRLVSLAEGYKMIRGADLTTLLRPHCLRTFTHKRERNQSFQTLCEQLAA